MQPVRPEFWFDDRSRISGVGTKDSVAGYSSSSLLVLLCYFYYYYYLINISVMIHYFLIYCSSNERKLLQTMLLCS